MQNQSQHRTDIEKLNVLLPYWVNHYDDHIRDQEKWLKKAEKEGLIEVVAELKKAIDHSKKANHHLEQAGYQIKDEKASIKELDSKSDANYGWLEDLDNRDHLMLHIKGIPHSY